MNLMIMISYLKLSTNNEIRHLWNLEDLEHNLVRFICLNYVSKLKMNYLIS